VREGEGERESGQSSEGFSCHWLVLTQRGEKCSGVELRWMDSQGRLSPQNQEIWLPPRDSNPDNLLQRQVS
jgi:hypothetical protein